MNDSSGIRQQEAFVLDKYEKKVRVNQIVSCIRNGEYLDAQEIADSIDWRQEKSIRTLRMVSEVYKINRRYDDSLTVLNLAYEKNPEDPIKRKIVYDLCELAIKMGQFGVAVRYMKEFSKLAPKDPGRYILQYRLLKATDAEYDERIELLEEFKSRHFGDFDGRWAYELAYLYHLTGKGDKCVECCNEIALWFVTGPVVVKALKLKKEHQELSYEEEQKIIGGEGSEAEEEVLYQKKHKTDTAPVYVDTTPEIGDGYSTTDAEDRLQPEPVPGVNEMPQAYNVEPEPQTFNIEVKKVDASLEPTIRMAEKKTGPSIMARDTMVLPKINKTQTPESEHVEHKRKAELPQQVNVEEPAVRTEPLPEPEPQPVEIKPPMAEEIRPNPLEETAKIQTEPAIPGVADAITQTGTIAQQEISVNLDKFSTMNLQAELRANMEKLQEETGEPLREREEKLPDRVAGPDKDLTELKAGNNAQPEKEEIKEPEKKEEQPVNEAVQGAGRYYQPVKPEKMTDEEVAAKISSIPAPDPFKNYISQDYDGQMQLNVPEDDPLDEKQITGQMDIESILAQWDKLQEEARERRLRAAKNKSLEQTNELSRQLVGVLPGYELPKPEEEKKPEPVPESRKPEKTEMKIQEIIEPEKPEPSPSAPATSAFTAPLVVPEDGTGEIKVKESEIAPSEPESYDHEQTPEERYESEAKPKRKPEKDTEEKKEEPEKDTKEEALQEEKNQDPTKKNPHFVTFETVELPSVFDSFRNIKGLPQQLKEAEERMSMESAHGNVLIIGSEHAARMELVQAIIRDMGEKDATGTLKAAAIDADTFNNKDVTKSLKALAGNILVIEGAGRLSDDSMNSLLSVLSSQEMEILVIFEDSKSGAKNLSEYSGFDEAFDVLIDIPTLSNDYLVDHSKSYAAEKGYTLDDMAVLALYQRIDERQTADHVVTSDEVEHIMDAAIKKANKKNLKHLGDVLLGKRYNDDDLIVLREKDFAK